MPDSPEPTISTSTCSAEGVDRVTPGWVIEWVIGPIIGPRPERRVDAGLPAGHQWMRQKELASHSIRHCIDIQNCIRFSLVRECDLPLARVAGCGLARCSRCGCEAHAAAWGRSTLREQRAARPGFVPPADRLAIEMIAGRYSDEESHVVREILLGQDVGV